MENFIERETERIRAKVGKAGVVCGMSGGVDSTGHRGAGPPRRRAISSPASSSTTACCGATSEAGHAVPGDAFHFRIKAVGRG